MANLRMATKEDVRALYPEGLSRGFQGITAEINGEPVGIAGVYFNHNWIAFARIKPELREHKLTIYKASKKLMDMMEKLDKPVYAIADPSIPNSDELLLKMGFEYVGKDWYLWTP